jgi:predicted dehydrogenase
MVYGSEGTLVVQNKQLLLATSSNEDGEPVDVPALPPEERNSAEFFLSHIRSGAPIEGLCSPEVSLLAQEVLEAGLLSVEQGCAVPLPLPIGRYAASRTSDHAQRA